MIELATAVALFTGVIMLLTMAIVVARFALVATGSVSVSINDGQRQLQIDVGQKLLNALAAQDLFLPSACGGKGTCGQCRVTVLAGGGPLLPTERALITPKQAALGERLACQLVAKEELSIRLPEHLLSVGRVRCLVRSNRNVATFIKELVLVLPPNASFEFRAGSYIQIECPPFSADFQDFSIEQPFRSYWDDLRLWQYETRSRKKEVRAYSLANYPGEGDELILNVRIAIPPRGAPAAVQPGIVSSYLFSLGAGDEVDVTGPFGDFFAKSTDLDMVFIGGGAGMAPMRSHILDQLRRLGSRRRVTFFYGARSLQELFYVDLFDQLAEEHDNFEWYVALSEPLPEDRWEGLVGFVHEHVYEWLVENHPDPAQCEFYLCGPPLMNDAVINMLWELGVEKDQIAMDDFGSATPIRSKGVI